MIILHAKEHMGKARPSFYGDQYKTVKLDQQEKKKDFS